MAWDFWPFIKNINYWRLRIRKKNALLNLISHKLYIDKTYSYAKDPFKPKHQLLLNKCENVFLKIIDVYILNIKHKIFIAVNDMIADMTSKKKSANIHWITY